MKQTTHTKLNWLDRSQLAALLEQYGFAVNASESDDDLRNALRENISDGTIPESEL